MLPSGNDFILPFHAILPLTTTHKASLDVIGKRSFSISTSASCSRMETAVFLMLRKLYLTWCIEMIYDHRLSYKDYKHYKHTVHILFVS
jgi:hypothetical protein